MWCVCWCNSNLNNNWNNVFIRRLIMGTIVSLLLVYVLGVFTGPIVRKYLRI